MEVIKSKAAIIVAVIILILIAQLFRMDTLVKMAVNEQLSIDEYSYENAMKLSEEEKNSVLSKRIIILYNPICRPDSVEIIGNLRKTFDYLKAAYEIVDINEEKVEFNDYDTVILLEQSDSEDLRFDEIIEFVNEGGRLLYLGNGNAGEDSVLKTRANLFGINKWADIKGSNDVYFNSEILLGLKGALELGDDPLTNYNNFEYLDADIDNNVIVHLEDILGAPIIWEVKKQNGNLMVMNTGKYGSKESRGLIVGAISLMEELFIYPIINSTVIFLDDFPADYNANPELYKTHYGRNTDRFVKEIWWPDMVKLMKKYNLKYTAAYIEHYTDKVSGEFENNDLAIKTTKELATDILKYQGEISFHGYNHQSLLYKEESSKRNDYKNWKSPEDIINSIQKTISGFNKIFPNYKFYTYVPPSNLLDPEAIPALRKAIPTLRTISGLYFGDMDDYGIKNQDVFEQEIGLDDRYGVALPRIASGVFYDEHMSYSVSSVVTMHGLINHFMHPDELLDPERSLGLLWEELYKKTDDLFQNLDKRYKWMEKDIASLASEKVRQYDYSNLYYDINNNTISILMDNFDKEASLILATNKTIVSSTDSEYIKIGQNRYLVKMKKNKVYLEVQ